LLEITSKTCGKKSRRLREKAEQGIYPSRPPFGYRNNLASHTIEIEPDKAPLAKRMFELYASGNHSLSSLRKTLKLESLQSFRKSYLHRLLMNPFYKGQFVWQGKLFRGTHTPLISSALFEQVQSVFRGHNKPRPQMREFAFRGLLTCAYDNCGVTAEIKKGKYTYYRCTGSRGKCDLPYMREEALSERLGQILKNIYIPDEVLVQLERALLANDGRQKHLQRQQRERLQQRLVFIAQRLRRSNQMEQQKYGAPGGILPTFWFVGGSLATQQTTPAYRDLKNQREALATLGAFRLL
jgi:site-specific DNA recombinase